MLGAHRELGGLASAPLMLTRASTVSEIKYRENLALRDLVRPFANAGLELEAAMSAAYRRGLADAGVIPAGSPLLNLKQRVRV